MDGNKTTESLTELPQPIQPGQTISPGAGSMPTQTTIVSPSVAGTSKVQIVQEESTPQETAPIPQNFMPQQTEEYRETSEVPSLTLADPVSWTASEFIAHEKSPNWYVLLFGSAIIVAGVLWLLTKDVLSSVVILIAAGMLASYSARKPRELQYMLDSSGITIGEKHYPYGMFRSFSVIDEGPFSSIELMPLKRFSPPISMYYDPANEGAIADALTPHLPFHAHEPDPIDRLIKRIRF